MCSISPFSYIAVCAVNDLEDKYYVLQDDEFYGVKTGLCWWVLSATWWVLSTMRYKNDEFYAQKQDKATQVKKITKRANVFGMVGG